MSQFVCIQDFERYAHNNLKPSLRDFYASGSGGEYSLKLNQEAFKKFRLRPRVLRDVSKRDLSTTVLGDKVSMPLGVSPSSMQKMAHPDGECAHVKAVQAAKTVFILSTMASSSIEEVAEAAPDAIKWFQLYVYVDRSISLNLINRAEKAGFKALVLTVDRPIGGDRRSDIRNNFSIPSYIRLANFEEYLSKKNPSTTKSLPLRDIGYLFDSSVTWKDVEWLKSVTKLPIVLKGILTAEDALLAVKYGASAILVSNHGARQIDGTPAPIEALPEIVKAVGDKVEVYMDGGVRQGTDVLKALALGAGMVFVGRPMLWGLSYGGEKGATAVLEMMRREIDQAFALAGCSNVKQVSKDMVVHESFYSHL